MTRRCVQSCVAAPELSRARASEAASSLMLHPRHTGSRLAKQERESTGWTSIDERTLRHIIATSPIPEFDINGVLPSFTGTPAANDNRSQYRATLTRRLSLRPATAASW